MHYQSSTPIEVLLVEDDIGDIKLTRRVLDQSKLHLNINVVHDGIEAMKFLHAEGDFAGRRLPDLVLLDLNLPKMDGREVLKAIREDESLVQLPVVILTTSDAEEDIGRSYALHANCYISKPVDLAQFTKVVQAIEQFWLTVVKLPTRATE